MKAAGPLYLGEMQCRSGAIASGDVGQVAFKADQHSDKVCQDLWPAGGELWVIRRAPTLLLRNRAPARSSSASLGVTNGQALN
jgi:hypothetical protein